MSLIISLIVYIPVIMYFSCFFAFSNPAEQVSTVAMKEHLCLIPDCNGNSSSVAHKKRCLMQISGGYLLAPTSGKTQV